MSVSSVTLSQNAFTRILRLQAYLFTQTHQRSASSQNMFLNFYFRGPKSGLCQTQQTASFTLSATCTCVCLRVCERVYFDFTSAHTESIACWVIHNDDNTMVAHTCTTNVTVFHVSIISCCCCSLHLFSCFNWNAFLCLTHTLCTGALLLTHSLRAFVWLLIA